MWAAALSGPWGPKATGRPRAELPSIRTASRSRRQSSQRPHTMYTANYVKTAI